MGKLKQQKDVDRWSMMEWCTSNAVGVRSHTVLWHGLQRGVILAAKAVNMYR